MMKYRKTLLYISIIIFLISTTLLVTGSSLLTRPLGGNDGIPLGNITTWLGIISIPILILFSHKSFYNSDTTFLSFSNVLKALILLSVFWLPICYLLAGNFNFSFTEKAEFQGGQLASRIFWYFTYFIVVAPIVLFLIQRVFAFTNAKKD